MGKLLVLVLLAFVVYALWRSMLAKARDFLPGLKPEGGVQWMGFRPSLPDSLRQERPFVHRPYEIARPDDVRRRVSGDADATGRAVRLDGAGPTNADDRGSIEASAVEHGQPIQSAGG